MAQLEVMKKETTESLTARKDLQDGASKETAALSDKLNAVRLTNIIPQRHASSTGPPLAISPSWSGGYMHTCWLFGSAAIPFVPCQARPPLIE